MSETHIRLIPKIHAPKRVADYRPIALCSVYYKIISKLLSRRLQPVLSSVVSENQSAFVPGRAISDNVLITHETLHFLKTSMAEMVIKSDMSKAYDRMEWSFIRLVLHKLGFHTKFIDWIMQCICSVSYAFLINGSPRGHVLPNRGIRQGDPLSPYLFILCSEVLSGLCNQALINGSLPGIRVARGSPRVNHLLFADDTMIFCKANKRCCESLKKILDSYKEASGQTVNYQKSSITFSKKTPLMVKRDLMTALNIDKEGGVGKYLGLPEHFGRRKKDLFTEIVDRIRQKSIGWSSRFLSSAGKMTMLKSVLSTMPAYAMSCFQLPTSLCKRIQSALTTENGLGCVGQANEGGLGYRDIQSFNTALLAKQSWRILFNPDSLLARVLLGKSFMECTSPATSSHGWKGLLVGRDLLAKHIGWAVGNGLSIRVWQDNWLSLSSQTKLMGPIQEKNQGITVSELFKSNSSDWDCVKLQLVCPTWKKQILCLKPSITGAPDRRIWLGNKSGDYTTKSGYHAAREEKFSASTETSHREINWITDIWNLHTSPKLKMFTWKTARDALPVNANLFHRTVSLSPACPGCGNVESVSHVLFHCQFAQDVVSDVRDIMSASAGMSNARGKGKDGTYCEKTPSQLAAPDTCTKPNGEALCRESCKNDYRRLSKCLIKPGTQKKSCYCYHMEGSGPSCS